MEQKFPDVIVGIHAITSAIPGHDANGLTEQVTAASTSNKQVAVVVSYGWKVFLHEECNQIYNWIISTGET